ncbi:MAG: hypothetical protein ACMUJM_01115 [bacterium]
MIEENTHKKVITTVAQLIDVLYKEVEDLELTQKEKTLLVYYMANDILEKNQTNNDIFFHHPSHNRVISSHIH